jgi:uncharacterized protein
MKRLAAALWLLIAITALQPAAAQDFDFEPPADADDPALSAALHDLAERVLPTYQEDDADRYLSSLAALQLAIGDPTAAHDTRLKLQERLQSRPDERAAGRAVVYDIYTHARALEASEGISFAAAYAQAFREAMNRIDDLAAYELERHFLAAVEPLRDDLQRVLEARRGQSSIALEEALDLTQAWLAFDAYRSIEGLVRPLLAEDAERRYVSEDVAIPVAADAMIAAALVRPRRASDSDTLPSVLEFTVDRSGHDAREAAAHGYASVLTRARIAGELKFRPRAPFESEADDAWAVIAWIAAQPWSDGRVAMQGSRYGGFVAWAAAKRRPPALKAIATSDPMAPGIDIPGVNRIVQSSAYRWLYELLAPPGEELADEAAHWRAVEEEWYRAGRSYRDLAMQPGRAGAIFRSWLNHPSYDRFWQKWLPFGTEFAAIDIPVLTMTGYYSAGQTAALYYFTEHHGHDADANHAMLIGPFNEQAVIRGAASSVGGLPLDIAARIDPSRVRYAWLEHVLKGSERPALLGADVNYEVAGTNEWRHSSLAQLEERPLRFYLEAGAGDAPNRLAPEPPRAAAPVTLTTDLRDRADVAWEPTRELVLEALPMRDAAVFMTEAFGEALDVAGRFSGTLDLTINKQDADFVMMLYELTAAGEYVKLFDPPFSFRASYALDRVHRRLLTAGVRLALPFQSERFVGRRLEAGSRLVLTIGINKRVDQQINYGAGRDVSEESIDDAGAPMRIRLHEGSFVEIPSQPVGEASADGASQ